jgi:hypothetical protein
MEYFVVRQAGGGATVAARLAPQEAAALRPEVELLVKGLTAGPVVPTGVVPIPGK